MKKILVIIMILVMLMPSLTQAISFNQNYIISDNDLTNHLSMSQSRIDEFLDSMGGAISDMTFTGLEGQIKTASQIIFDTAQYYQISPKYLLVLLQKEQSLVTNPYPEQRDLDWATGYAVCDDCSKDDPDIQQYRGFFNQVNWGARRIREKYLDDLDKNGHTFTGWGPGITKITAEGDTVTPANDATACLYTYTPHVAGNYSFWRLWNAWFQKNYPDGSLLRAEGESGIWLIQNGQKRPFWSRSAFFASHDPSRVITVSPTDLNAYASGLPIKYADYTLIQSPHGTIYLIVDGQKRGIESMEVFRNIGFNPEEVIKTDWRDVHSFPDGEPITMNSVYPTGALLQSATTGGIFYVEEGVKHSVWSREILTNRFAYQKWSMVTDEELSLYDDGEPVKFKDGELVTSPGTNSVFVISNGKRRSIASKDVFETLGYRWENVIWTSDQALLRAHLLGEPIDFE